jgi:hypothetical protein
MKKRMLLPLAISGALLTPFLAFGDLMMPGYENQSQGGTASSSSQSLLPDGGLKMPEGLQYEAGNSSMKGSVKVGNNGLMSFMPYAEGPRLITLGESNTVFWVSSSNFKLPMLSEKVFKSYNNKWEDVARVEQDEFDYYPETRFIRLAGNGAIYFLDEAGMKRVIPTKIWNEAGIDAEEIIDVNKTEFNSYKTGAAIKEVSEITGADDEPGESEDSGGIDPSTIQWSN